MKFWNTALLTGMILLAGIAGLAQTVRADDLTGFFVGGNFARSRIDHDFSRYETQLEAQSKDFGRLDFTNSLPHKRSNAWWADVGYMIWPTIGIEASFLHLGESTNRGLGTFSRTGSNPQAVVVTEALRSSGPALSALFRLPLMEALDVNIRIGDYYGRTYLVDGVLLNSYMVSTQTTRTSSLLLGAGAGYNFSGHWSARLDYLHVNKAGGKTTGTYKADVASIGMTYTF